MPWFPTVDIEKYIGCKECYNFYSHEFYAWDEKNNNIKIAEAYNCVIGWSICTGMHSENTITFPPLTIFKKFKKIISIII